MAFNFVDLFAGIGGFYGALRARVGECVFATEINKDDARTYLRNWGTMPEGDLTAFANGHVMQVPVHDVLVGGFPCQPFTKFGKQLSMEETRGALFWNIAKIMKIRKPKIVLLETVRNIAGSRQDHEWKIIVHTLSKLGNRISMKPFLACPNH
jgi:DNA (cytosine-5)-methyltransferase 1